MKTDILNLSSTKTNFIIMDRWFSLKNLKGMNKKKVSWEKKYRLQNNGKMY